MAPRGYANEDITSIIDTFSIINQNGILSTDSEDNLETEQDSEPEAVINDIELSSSINNGVKCTAMNIDSTIEKKGNETNTNTGDLSGFFEKLCFNYLDFTDKNPTTYHVISYFTQLLTSSRFKYIPESSFFEHTKKGGLFFTKRDDQSMIAFVVGGKWVPENGIAGIGCHVDALTLKLKPCSLKTQVSDYELLGVAPYSGALNHLWLDRDLGIAGSILVRDSVSGKIQRRIITSGKHAVCRIPSLAPHFGIGASPPYNKETQMIPVLGYGTVEPLATDDEKTSALYGKHSLGLLRYIAKLADVKVSQMVEADLDLYDVQPATRGGLSDEFIFAPRIDDRLCAFSAIHGLLKHSMVGSLEEFDGFLIVLLANNEEIGSATRTGAKGKLLNSVVERVLVSRKYKSSDLALVFANSVILSADVTHALNPNFTEAYLERHSPVPNKGLVLKLDASGHVVTDLTGQLLMNLIAQKNNLKLQEFHIRNDRPSGGTIGPMLAVDTGSRVIDVGLAQLSMHSIRASTGFKEPGIGVKTFEAFFRCWRAALSEIEYD
ncbi:hypothetical protein METBIDRAFT_30303 [Metschnikowia bicuspidata var. bicuspidata NRRL YB-4993]|uniref:Peptidase M18, aminopeptidase I n=1 Tax=Metschnikowia bicuspidata var. bicuspidata NRRL YB-4993 TaxID=869754 RepID=A0A1A0HIV7_9ASCO|nr:hypothetical protein METBIDRAFT_30303 [Metschnikowia bicuspidata var. bicuspidata NRRL YB-4993]OBA23945.1 hypothetical protein METBIDRAFT_30303 [Metschnikowia bicuspidata var. bicuspidata NRRL YB-4993]